MKLDIKNKTLIEVVKEIGILNQVRDGWHFKGKGNGNVEVVNESH